MAAPVSGSKLFMLIEGAAVASSFALALRSWKLGEKTWDTTFTILATAAIGLPFFAMRLHQTTASSTARSRSTKVHSIPATGPSHDSLLPTPAQTQYLIANRRSIFPRDFNGQTVAREKIQAMLEAANWAPSHGLTEPWRFVVMEGAEKARFEGLTVEATEKLEGEERDKKLKKMMMNKESKWPKVSHFIAINMKRQAKPPKLMPEWEEMCAVASAVQNMQLTATTLGVACYWSSWAPHVLSYPPVREFFELGEEDKCLGILVVGHSDNTHGYRGSRKPVMEKVRWLTE